jgi:shikimate kinase
VSAAEPVRPRLVLVGPMGAGKTTVGTLIAAEWQVGFRDTDTDIQASEGRTVQEIFVEDGEERFRALERAAVAAALVGFDGVLALGGGAILAEPSRLLLRGHRVVYLSVNLADAASRVGLGAGRPLLAINPRATLRHLMELRRPHYEEVASLIVDTSGRPPADIAAEIVKHFA